LFDRVARKPMITAAYPGLRDLTICCSPLFFVATSAASAAYLTVSLEAAGKWLESVCRPLQSSALMK
jgi:hypothetical protein